MKITDTIKYAGVNDHKVDLFEGQYPVPNGMSYNSYVILDEKTAVMDTVDAGFTHEWLDNLEQILDGIRKAKARLTANVNFDLTMELLFLLIKENQ